MKQQQSIVRSNAIAQLVVLLAMSFAATSLQAKSGSISLAPASIELKGKAGQGTHQTLSITNDTAAPMAFELAVLDVVTHDGKRLFIPAGELPNSIAATAMLAPKRLLVGPRETGSAEITVTLPAQTAIRAIVARFQGVDPHAGPGHVGVTLGLGSLITFNITDEVSAKSEPLVVLPQTATTALGFSEWVTNTGAEPFIEKGVIAILDSSQHLVTKLELPRTRFLPGERLELKAEVPGELPAGTYRAVLTLSYENRVLTRIAEWQSQ